MSSSGEFPAIVTQIGGVQMRLVTPNQLRNAVTRKLVEPSTLIIYEKGPSQSEEIFAGECDLLRPIFEKEGLAAPPPPLPPAPPPPAPPIDPEDKGVDEAGDAGSASRRPWGNPDSDDGDAENENDSAAGQAAGGVVEPVKGADGNAGTAKPGGDVGVDDAKPEGRGSGDGGYSGGYSGGGTSGDWWRTPVMIGLAIAAIAAVFIAINANREPEEVEPESSTYYAMSGLSVRTVPTTTSGEEVKQFLKRNEEIQGYRLPDNLDWVKITAGPYKGKHVSYKYLDTKSRVAVDKSTGRKRPYKVVKDTKAYASPNNREDLVAEIDFPDEIEVIGSVSSRTAEVYNPDWPTPIAYMPWDAFGGEGGEGNPREIRVNNKCSRTTNFTMSYFENGRNRRVNTYWKYNARTWSYPLHNNKRITPTSTEIYYYDLGSTFHLATSRRVQWIGKDRLRVNGQIKTASLATPRASGSKTYEITFCAENK